MALFIRTHSQQTLAKNKSIQRRALICFYTCLCLHFQETQLIGCDTRWWQLISSASLSSKWRLSYLCSACFSTPYSVERLLTNATAIQNGHWKWFLLTCTFTYHSPERVV